MDWFESWVVPIFVNDSNNSKGLGVFIGALSGSFATLEGPLKGILRADVD